jgi:phytoene dehydrogenase-like protein
MTDVVVIGGGLNGLVAAALLAKQKLSVAVLDQRPVAGGAAITTELAPGYHAPTLAHSIGPVSLTVMRTLGLDRAGLDTITPTAPLTTIGADGRALVFHRDGVLTSAAINAFSPVDAAQWIEFKQTLQKVAGIVARLDRIAPPSMDGPARRDWWHFLELGRHARSLGRKHLSQLARWMPMPVGDLVSEWFETDVLKAAIAAHAIFGNPAGPRSAGTGAMLIGRMAADAMPIGSGVSVRGGPGALTAAVARVASQHGASILTNAKVTRIVTEDGRATGVVLDNGDTIQARAIVAAISPKSALIDLVSPQDLAPTFLHRARHIRARGVTAKINLALDALPAFTALAGDAVPLGGRILIAPDLDYLERAYDATKYGAMSDRPWLEISIPTINDPSLAPPGCHVMSIVAHCAPRHLRDATWTDARETLASRVMQVLEAHMPSVAQHIVAREIITPEDLEQRWGLAGGHIFHAESTLDQSWVARPILGWAEYRTPIAGLYLGSAGTHPGGGLTGLPGLLSAQTVMRDFKKRRSGT